MTAVDTSTLIAYLEGREGADTGLLDGLLARGVVVLPPLVLTEILSSQRLSARDETLLRGVVVLTVHEGYWERTGVLRRRQLAAGLRASVADCLIAQTCMDHRLPLLTRDADFLNFQAAGLKLVPLH